MGRRDGGRIPAKKPPGHPDRFERCHSLSKGQRSAKSGEIEQAAQQLGCVSLTPVLLTKFGAHGEQRWWFWRNSKLAIFILGTRNGTFVLLHWPGDLLSSR